MMCGHGCTTGAVMVENAVSVPSDSLIVLDAIEVVAERLLEPVPVQDCMPLSVQGRIVQACKFLAK